MEKKDVRIQLVISPSEVEALDGWSARDEVWSGSEAIREAVRRMIASDGSTFKG
jgi:Arc/MetJ-type ribon-helix-helix transcriptional regulator